MSFAAIAITLYVAHHVGDYWVQTDHQARHKGAPGADGRLACLAHVLSYLATQTALLIVVTLVTGAAIRWWSALAGLVISGVTHYIADRREPLKRIARLVPGKAAFLTLGVPRPYQISWPTNSALDPHGPLPLDNPSLGTGLWALDQSWHIFWGVFVAALVMSA